MRILHISTSDTGGAARAMLRWHEQLKGAGVDSRVLCFRKSLDHSDIFEPSLLPDRTESIKSQATQERWIDRCRTSFSDDFFSQPFYSHRLIGEELVEWAEVLHFHWISRSFDISSLADLATRGKALVLTPHDLWTITGGCHYPAGCRKFLEGCLACPMVTEGSHRLVEVSHRYKREYFSQSVHALICPSTWIRNEIIQCPGFQTIDSFVVPYAWDTEGLWAEQKETARAILNVPTDRNWVLFVVDDVNESRTGFRDFLQLITGGEQRLRAAGRENAFGVLIAGRTGEIREDDFCVPVIKLGFPGDVSALRNACSAADLLAYTGLEDNLPNVILEALACGTPVLGYATGGVGDLVRSGENGKLEAVGDIEGLTNSLVDLLMNPIRIEELTGRARKFVEINFDNQKTIRYLRSAYDAALSKARIKAIGSNVCDERVEYHAFALRAIVDLLERAEQKATELEYEVRWLREQSSALGGLREILERSFPEIDESEEKRTTELEYEVRWLRNQSVEFGSVRELLRICIAEIDVMFSFAPVQVRNQYAQIAKEITEKGTTETARSLDEQWRETSTKIYLLKEVLGWRPEKR